MPTARRLIFSLIFVAMAAADSPARQDGRAVQAHSTDVTVTAAAIGERVRFSAPLDVVQMHIEVYTESAVKLFDFELKSGNVFDWNLQDGKAERLGAGYYLCVVTVKSLSGKLTQKLGAINLADRFVTVEPAQASTLNAKLAQAIGPLQEDSSLQVIRPDEQLTTVVSTHSGEEGQITRGRGALSFRLGDFYSGKDQEQMRLTEEGNLGIGISQPRVRLDVDGMIRSSKGILFPDGTIQTTAAIGGSVSESAEVGKHQNNLGNLQGSANQNGDKGKVGKKGIVSPDLFVNEDLTVNGNIIFTPPPLNLPQRDITIQNNTGGLRFFGAPTLTSSPAAAAIQFWGNASLFPGQLYLDSGADNSGAVIIRTAETGGTITERMRVTANGNVGIGSTNPSSGRLQVEAPSDAAGFFKSQSGRGVQAIAGIPSVFFVPQAAVWGDSASAVGLAGTSQSSSGVTGTSNSGFGGDFVSLHGVGLRAIGNSTSSGGTGIQAQAGSHSSWSTSAGVWGDSGLQTGVAGTSDSSSGVIGRSSSGDGGDFRSNIGRGIYASGDTYGGFFETFGNGIGINVHSVGGVAVFARSENTHALYADGSILVNRWIVLNELRGGGGSAVCRNSSNELSFCSSSMRYKSNIGQFSSGLNLIGHLHPITFDWKADGKHDFGLAAEDVEKIDPLLVTYNKDGQVEGVKYDRIGVVLINAVKEQQAQIEAQRKEVAALKKVVCLDHPEAEACKPSGSLAQKTTSAP